MCCAVSIDHKQTMEDQVAPDFGVVPKEREQMLFKEVYLYGFLACSMTIVCRPSLHAASYTAEEER